MKRLLITLIALITAITAEAQLNASQIKKDGVTIVANSLNQIVCDTVNKIATKFDVWSIGGSGTVTSVGTGLGLTGGTITTTGTISLDTASSVVLSRQRAANTYQPIGSYLTVLCKHLYRNLERTVFQIHGEGCPLLMLTKWRDER